MSAHLRPLEPNRSALDFFGAELRHRRIEAGLSLAALAAQTFVTAHLIGKVETAQRFPSLDLAHRADSALNAAGTLIRLHGLAVAERQRRGHVGGAGLDAVETVQLRRLLTAISLVTAAQGGSPGLDLLDRIDGVLSVCDAATPGRATWARVTR